ncbi:thioredoxin domain-containing protein [Pseudanabaenaceae cyanobacterium LEGE 13415]|nr:thioredoxin domain-containing protein [Pseudanabaenaceae cyanobacterium LEGE 13415]
MSSANASVDLTLPVGQHDHVQGSLSAPIMLVEYGDYQCPYCAKAVGVVQEIQNQYEEQLCYVFRHFPLTQHAYAMRAATAAEAAAAQNEFWQMHYCLFSYQSDLSDEALLRYANGLELDMDQFRQDLNSSDELHRIQADIQSGIDSGVDRTPTFFINGVHYQGDTEITTLLKAIKEYAPNFREI